MRIESVKQDKLKEYIKNLSNYIESRFELYKTLYIDLGVKTVRLLIYSEEFIPHIEKQLSYCIKENANGYNATIVLWKEPNAGHIYKIIAPEFDLKTNLKRRVELLALKRETTDDLWVYDDSYSKLNPVIQVSLNNNIVNLIDSENKTYYYGVENLKSEEFIKEGHIFVQNLNRILKTDNTSLVHGAAVGLDNKGILFCARGQRGKSTLSVLSMIRGFDYVSDDYLTLEKTENELFAYPIYSIITLSPKMYNKLYDDLKDCRFVSNNARKDKYVFNIANFHHQFKTKYPIELCIFPEIVQDKEPEIKPCTLEEKGRAIVQLIHSTTMQMQDMADTQTVQKLFETVKNFEFYKFNLCSDIEENTRFLKKFLVQYKPQKDICKLPDLIEDVTFDIANIINTKSFSIYAMNKFGTMIYQNLKSGVSKVNIINELSKIGYFHDKIDFWLDNFLLNMQKEGLIKNYCPDEGKKCYINKQYMEEDNYYPWIAKFYKDKHIELNKKEYENEQL